ncbi:MAG: aerotolerance regulator BatA [Candidatus Hydrogenedentota bacterium]|nr:MAG: aerotolerance regulator BatA [Candidatus Hydrogenedentota bacterium]
MTLWSNMEIDTFKDPAMLWLLVPVFLLLAAEVLSRPHGVLSISTGDLMTSLNPKANAFMRRLPAVLRTLGLICLIIALARPLTGMRPRVESAKVRDIMLAVDVSGSMTAPADVIGNRRLDRLDVTKLAVNDFIVNRKSRETDRFGTDRVGLTLYASYAWIQTPLTLDYGLLEYDLSKVYIDQHNEKHNRTAIGSAIGLAISNLSKSEAESKVIILMTDGINNAGKLDPITAAQLAAKFNIRVYTIGAGSPDSRFFAAMANPIDETAMQRIAEITGGKYYRATDFQSLQEAYQEINELETTEIETGEVFDYDEGFLPYAMLGTCFIGVSLFSRRKWFEAIP